MAVDRGSDVVFVVSTGRCGSTLVSNLLRHHADVLSLSELFGQLYPFRFPPDAVCSGADFWAWLSDPNPLLTLLLRNGAEPDELLYPEDGKWFDRENGIPAVLATTLPHLVNGEADAELSRLADAVPEWGAATVAEQFERLFSFLDRSRRRPRVRVERSGASLLFVGELLCMFPAARFVFLYRNGMDTASSMLGHPMYRLLYSVDAQGTASAELSADAPVSWFGAFWSRMILEGLRRLGDVPTERLLTINYEYLGANPAETLPVLAAFLGVDSSHDWITAGREMIRLPQQASWRRESEQEQQRLVQACGPGTRQLRRFLRSAPPWSLPPSGDVAGAPFAEA